MSTWMLLIVIALLATLPAAQPLDGYSWISIDRLPANWSTPQLYFAPVKPDGKSPEFHTRGLVRRGSMWVGSIPAFQRATFVVENDLRSWLHCEPRDDGTTCLNTTNGVNFVVTPGNYTITVGNCTNRDRSCTGSIKQLSTGNLTCPAGPDVTNGFTANVSFIRGGTSIPMSHGMAGCSNSGACTTTLECQCNGGWSGPSCSDCSCDSSAYCEAGSGRCVALQPPHTVDMALAQGILVVLVDVSAYTNAVWKESTYIHANIRSLSTNWKVWSHIPTKCTTDTTPREASLIPNHTAYSDCSQWRVAYLPTNAAVFMIISEGGGYFTHCSAVEGLPRSGARCTPDHHDQANNFLAYSGVVSIVAAATTKPVPMNVLHEYPSGCQWSAPDAVKGETPQNLSSMSRCGCRGMCDLTTSFSCNCNGNYSGLGCATCDCSAPFEECGKISGLCTCRTGYDKCGGRCHNVVNDTNNCGSCGNNCYDGQHDFVKSASCVLGQCHYEYRNRFGWMICFGSKDHNGQRVDVACFKGYSFLIIAVASGCLCLVCVWCYRQYRIKCPHTNKHRQVLFFLLAVIGGLRMIYAIIAIAVISTISTPHGAEKGEAFFKDSMITLNAFGDLFTGMVDLLLTVFWLFVLQRLSSFPQRALSFGYAGMFFTLLVATIIDYQVRPLTFNYTFFTIAIILFFTAMLHLFVILEVLTKMRQWRKLNSGEGAPLLQHGGNIVGLQNTQAISNDRVYTHFVRVGVIATVCFVCWLFRSMMLLGRATQKSLFTSGALSFANPNFTLCYYTVLSLLPCIIIAIAFFALSFDVLVGSSAVKTSGDTPAPSPERTDR